MSVNASRQQSEAANVFEASLACLLWLAAASSLDSLMGQSLQVVAVPAFASKHLRQSLKQGECMYVREMGLGWLHS